MEYFEQRLRSTKLHAGGSGSYKSLRVPEVGSSALILGPDEELAGSLAIATGLSSAITPLGG
jgi:hypothetical protein